MVHSALYIEGYTFFQQRYGGEIVRNPEHRSVPRADDARQTNSEKTSTRRRQRTRSKDQTHFLFRVLRCFAVNCFDWL